MLSRQIPLGVPQIDVEKEEANWGYDDIWRIVWMTIIFGALMPLSRSMWALKKNFSLAMWLHMVSTMQRSAMQCSHPSFCTESIWRVMLYVPPWDCCMGWNVVAPRGTRVPVDRVLLLVLVLLLQWLLLLLQ